MVQSQNPGAKSTSPGILFRVISPASTLSACLPNAPATGAVWITTATRGMGTGPNGAMSAPSVAGVASALAIAVTPSPQTGASRARVILHDCAAFAVVQVGKCGLLSVSAHNFV